MIHVVDAADQERAKYEEIWGFPEYKKYSPGLENVERFMSVMQPSTGSSVYDIGCGTGGAGLEFEKLGLRVTYVDITDAGLDPAVNRKNFIQAPLWARWAHEEHDYGFCCDVLEHIPPEYVMLCVDRCLDAANTVWFQIALRPDEFGRMIGEPLHLTVRPFDWWLIRLATVGRVMDARDLCGEGLFVVCR